MALQMTPEVALQIFRLLAEEVIELGGSDDDLRSLLTTKAKRRKVAEAIIGDGCSSQTRLRNGERLVYVDYGLTDATAELKERGVLDVYGLFGDKPWSWQKHQSCAGMDENNGVRVMILKRYGRTTGSEDAIADMDREGYRPATEKEFLAFILADRERLYSGESIVALGSQHFSAIGEWINEVDACNDCRLDVANLRMGYKRKNIITFESFSHRWPYDTLFLFVRK